MDRREFINYLGLGLLGMPLAIQACNSSQTKFQSSEYLSHSDIGHYLRNDIAIPKLFYKDTSDILIIGSGISGLMACRELEKKTNYKIKIIELSHQAGGNAIAENNQVSSFPWGAHYLPIPALHQNELLDFLAEIDIIEYYENDLPYYKEEYLCMDNKERLFINGQWQDGLIPQFNIGQEDKLEIEKFLQLIKSLRSSKDKNGLFYFDIPVTNSSRDNDFFKLNEISAFEWLQKENYSSPYLHWYINYCTSDDYGSNYKSTSAWAMLHYFASRKGQAANAKYDDLLTWPEGNAFLAKKIINQLKTKICCNEIALKIEYKPNEIIVYHLNTVTKKWTQTKCKKLILNTPFYVTKKLLPELKNKVNIQQFNSYPWLIANITLATPTEKNGIELSWDNVIYNSKALGFVNANHQSFSQKNENIVLTYFYALNEKSAKECRAFLYSKNQLELESIVLNDLKQIYDIAKLNIKEFKYRIIGHGMISPSPNFLFSKDLAFFNKAWNNIYFCHTDYCGISIFEEAFYKGIETAKKIIANEN